MSKKEFPIRGHCLSTNPIIVNYLKDNFEKFLDSVYSKKAVGVAWNKDKWWYISNGSSTPEHKPLVIMSMITTVKSLVTEPTKLRIKCRNLKKNLKL